MASRRESVLDQRRAPSRQKEGDWKLVDAEEEHRKHPDSFEIPSREERESLKRGILVKLHFIIPEGRRKQTHRMPVRITKRVRGAYEGVLESEPLDYDGLQVGDTISFRPEHIATVFIPVTDPRHPAYEKKRPRR